MPKAPQNIEVTAPARKATVVNHVFMLSTQTKTITAMRTIKMEHILYSAVMKAEAPCLMMAPISTTPGCSVFNSLSSSTLLMSSTYILFRAE